MGNEIPQLRDFVEEVLTKHQPDPSGVDCLCGNLGDDPFPKHQADEFERAHNARTEKRRKDAAWARAIEWAEYQNWVYEQAEAATKGYMLNRAGTAKGIDVYRVLAWQVDPEKWATEELQRWMGETRPMSKQEWRAGRRNARTRYNNEWAA